MESLPTQVIVAFSFGIAFVIVLMVVAFVFPRPTSFQYNVFRIILSLAAAGVAAMIPGFINVELNKSSEFIIRAGGALAVFVIVYFFNPANLALQNESLDNTGERIPDPPTKLPSGAPFPVNKIDAFNKVWQSLIALESSGEALWRHVTNKTISDFADWHRRASGDVRQCALFFSEEDYVALKDLLMAAAQYLYGKRTLVEMYERMHGLDGVIEAPEGAQIREDSKKQIRQNEEWLTRYKNLLSKIRTSLHQGISQ